MEAGTRKGGVNRRIQAACPSRASGFNATEWPDAEPLTTIARRLARSPGSPCRSMPGKASACAGAPAGCCRRRAGDRRDRRRRAGRCRCWCSAIPRPPRSASSRSENGLAAQLAALIAASTGRAVRWRAAGFNSATSGQIRDHVVPNLAADPWTHIVLAIGTNDVKNFHSLPRFKKEFGGLLYALARQMAGGPHRLAAGHRHDRRAGAAVGAGRRCSKSAPRRSMRWERRLCLERGACRRRGCPSPMPPPAFRATVSMLREAGYRAWAEHLLPFVLGERST